MGQRRKLVPVETLIGKGKVLREGQTIADVKYELHLKNKTIIANQQGNTGTGAGYSTVSGSIDILNGDLMAGEREVKGTPLTLVIEDERQFPFTIKSGNMTDNRTHIQSLGSP